MHQYLTFNVVYGRKLNLVNSWYLGYSKEKMSRHLKIYSEKKQYGKNRTFLIFILNFNTYCCRNELTGLLWYTL